jgi:hypothetical protein
MVIGAFFASKDLRISSRTVNRLYTLLAQCTTNTHKLRHSTFVAVQVYLVEKFGWGLKMKKHPQKQFFYYYFEALGALFLEYLITYLIHDDIIIITFFLSGKFLFFQLSKRIQSTVLDKRTLGTVAIFPVWGIWTLNSDRDL